MADGFAPVLLSLRRHGLVGDDEIPPFAPLTGGVSSQIWRVDLAGGPVCVKRARAVLAVGHDWRVPVERNANEVAWMEVAARLVPGCVPAVRLHEPRAGFFVMDHVDPRRSPVWKDELSSGRAEPAFAAETGDRLGRIHAGTAGDADIGARFATDAIFQAIRLDPYLETVARRHPRLAERLRAIRATTARTRLALVHGDVSPKNILCGPEGPIFLDAECAWYGDPAFDLAFCLNHLLLKCLWVPDAREAFLACFDALADGYRRHVSWEPPKELERRVAHLLPALLLARADGMSPAEYLTEADKQVIRGRAGGWLRAPAGCLSRIRREWP